MKVLITGNQGYIGTHTSDHLVRQGYDVIGLDSGFYKDCILSVSSSEIFTHQKDIRDAEKEDFADIDVVVHLAALSNDPLGELDSSLTFDINYKAAVRIAELSKSAGVSRFIFISTQSIYGISDSEIDLDEDNSVKNPQTMYAISKWKAEQEILEMGGPTFTPTALRPSTVFGWGSRLRSDIVFNNLLLTGLIKNRIEVHSDGSPWRPIVHIHDIALAIENCIKSSSEKVRGKAFNVGVLDGNYTVKELAEAAQICLSGVPIAFKTENIVDPRSYKVSFARAFKELGFEAQTTLVDGGAEIIQEAKILLARNLDLMGRKTNRLLQIKYLIEKGLVDDSLRFK
jgi:nucleoside-diphosphate-sugar epimerase